MSEKDLLILRDKWRSQNRRVVFTNGCFDILHLGHIDYLEKAKTKGDKLIVAVNTDKSVRRLKGSERPIVDEKARSRILASLEFVDSVVLFDDETPKRIIESLSPNVLVKGKDYELKDIVGADHVLSSGGTVETLDLVNGYSTTKIIKKINSLNS